MLIIFYFFFFVFGLFVGSFLNCAIYRLSLSFFSKEKPSKKRSFLLGRSYCPKCRHTLEWNDLIPVFSFLFLKGKCRYCGKKISWQYPIVELATALLFALIIYFNYQSLAFSFYLMIVACLLIVIFVFDLKHFIIPDRILLPAIIIVFLYHVYSFIIGNLTIINPLLSALGASLFFLAIFLISKGKWMGFGDVKLAFFMGLFLGFPNILTALFSAFGIGAIIGVGLILKGRKTLKSEIPFGPFLITGTFISLFWGEQIINWYLNLIL